MNRLILKSIIAIMLLFCFYSCEIRNEFHEKQDSLQTNIIPPKVNDEFTLYLNNFDQAELPVVIKGCNMNSNDFKTLDYKRFNKYSGDHTFAHKKIPTNGNYIATITLGAADCYLPILTTYKLDGEIIDRRTIAIGGCGSGCGFNCEEYMTLKSDYTFYTSDTISTYDCDSLTNEIPGTYKGYVIYKEGKLLPDGQIFITDKINKPLEEERKIIK